MRAVLIVAAALAAATAAAAEECPVVERSAQRAAPEQYDGGLLVLNRYAGDATPYLIQMDCITVDTSFWPRARRGRFLYLGVVNYVPGDEEPDVSYLGIQAVRRNPLRNGTDVIRLYRNALWIRETESGVEKLKPLPGRVTPLTIDAWKSLHADQNADVGTADSRLKIKWHAQPAEDVPSSWELRYGWANPFSYSEGTLLTNYLLRFTVNHDPAMASSKIIPFEIGVPQDADEVVVMLHSNIDALRRVVRIRLQ